MKHFLAATVGGVFPIERNQAAGVGLASMILSHVVDGQKLMDLWIHGRSWTLLAKGAKTA